MEWLNHRENRPAQHPRHFGDDIGISNLSCYSHGLMGYKTPNIDRIAKDGMMFTDSFGEQSYRLHGAAPKGNEVGVWAEPFVKLRLAKFFDLRNQLPMRSRISRRTNTAT